MLQRLIVLPLITAFVAAVRMFFRNRVGTSLEVLALRQQVAVLKRKRRRPALTRLDRLLWTTLRRVWPRWSDVLVIVKPENGSRMASGRLSPVLALAIAAAQRPAEGE